MDDDHGDVSYEMVMPFVVCAGQGDPYDDDAYVAGWEMAKLDSHLADIDWESSQTIRTQNVPQADLIGLEHGLVMESRPAEMFGEEWSYVRFTIPRTVRWLIDDV